MLLRLRQAFRDAEEEERNQVNAEKLSKYLERFDPPPSVNPSDSHDSEEAHHESPWVELHQRRDRLNEISFGPNNSFIQKPVSTHKKEQSTREGQCIMENLLPLDEPDMDFLKGPDFTGSTDECIPHHTVFEMPQMVSKSQIE